MPVTAIIHLRAASSGLVTRSFHCLMHPVFLDRISKADPALGKRLHDCGGMVPFSLSPIMGVAKRIKENESYWMRVCLLQDSLADAFLDSLEKNFWSEPIFLENHIFIPESVVFGKKNGDPWSGGESYREILESCKGSKRLTLHIASPLSFKRGDLHYPLPDPALIAGNLARRWDLFADVPLPENTGCDNISFSYLNIKTMPFSLRKGGTIIGSSGKISFIVKGSTNERRYFEALLRFAFYAGVGVKTTQGMGMCRMR